MIVLFKSKPIQELLKKGCSGTILTAINKRELEKIDIPFIEREIQAEIAKKIKASYDGKVSDEATVDLIVEECVDITTLLEGEPVELVIEEPEIKEPVTPVTEISFRESSEYLTLLIILFVIFAGGVIFLIGGAVILMKKKR